MRNFLFTLALVALCLGTVACDEDNPVKPVEFAVTLKVVDTDGAPVEGLRVGLVNDSPFFQDGLATRRAGVVVKFQIAAATRVRVSIQDIEGREIRVLLARELPAGWHEVIWDGRNDQEVHLSSGRFTAHIAVRPIDNDEILFEENTDMFLGMLDSSRVPTGYTDANGTLVLKDKKLFPHMYDRPEMVATDETGETIGALVLTSRMRISLVDENAGGVMWFEKDITSGSVLELVWNPPPPLAPPPATEFREKAPGNDLPPLVYKLGPVFPNPFN